MKHVVIIGNGIAGTTAARFIRKQSDYRVTMVSSESDHFFSRTALMYIYMGHMTYEHTKPYEDWFWAKNNIDLVRGYVDKVDVDSQQISIDGHRKLDYDILIVASGSKSNKFGWPGQDLTGVQGLYSLADLNEMELRTSKVDRAVVVGGGLIGIEMAEMLHSRHIPTTFLVREAGYMDYLLPEQESSMIGDEIKRHNIDLRLSTELKEIHGTSGSANAVTTSRDEKIDCQFVGLTAGVSPAVDFLGGSGIEVGRGVRVNEFFETSASNVYAIGDCAEFVDPAYGHRPIEQLWYTGRKQGKTVARNICGSRTPYDKGVFFNSAKFFTIEYQTYGIVPASDTELSQSLLWEDRERQKLIRICYNPSTNQVSGFNLLGVRFRHDQCEAWLKAGAPVDDVIGSLRKADFDPEFVSKHSRTAAQAIGNEITNENERGGRRSASPATT